MSPQVNVLYMDGGIVHGNIDSVNDLGEHCTKKREYGYNEVEPVTDLRLNMTYYYYNNLSYTFLLLVVYFHLYSCWLFN